jgi:hypothetical protein
MEDPLNEILVDSIVTRGGMRGRERYVHRNRGRENEWYFEKGLHLPEEPSTFANAFIRERRIEG